MLKIHGNELSSESDVDQDANNDQEEDELTDEEDWIR